MYVRKFEADSLDEALKAIKVELGPDAIILKTITNKGLKGAFKKKRIEITAAVSEKNYVDKSNVDEALGDKAEDFYNNSSEYISKSISSYNGNSAPANSSKGGYASLGLNKQVSTTQNRRSNPTKRAAGLDAFLSENELVENTNQGTEVFSREPLARPQMKGPTQDVAQNERAPRDIPSVEDIQASAPPIAEKRVETNEKDKARIDHLEKQVFEMMKTIDRMGEKGPEGLFQLRNTLRALDINDILIRNIMKKAQFELEQENLNDPEFVFEFCLKEMLAGFRTARPRFSSSEAEGQAVVTVLLSENSSGQTVMTRKLSALKGDSVLIKSVLHKEKESSFTEKIFGLKSVQAEGVPEIVSECRKAVESGNHVFIDFKKLKNEVNDVKNFIDGLRRSFKNVEVLVCLSAIHGEVINRKVLNTYRSLSDGIVLTHLDECLNYGALYNINCDYEELPFVFFGTGQTVPEDIEAASAERILGGMFQL